MNTISIYNDLVDGFPHLKKEGTWLEIYIVEVRNERGRLLKRFKPLEKLKCGIKFTLQMAYISLPKFLVERLNIGKGYKVAFIIAKCNGKVFLPFEVKCIGWEAEKLFETFSRLEVDLFLLCLEQPILNEASGYLWDAYFRLSDGDIEGARVALRNSLEILDKEASSGP